MPDAVWFPIKQNLEDTVFIHVKNLHPFFKAIKKAYKVLESDKFGTISYILRFYKRILKKLNMLPQVYNAGVNAFKDVYKEYWTNYFKEFDLVLYMATRLNPFIKHERCMTPEEIQRADTEILKIMNEIRPDPPATPTVPEQNAEVDDSDSSSESDDENVTNADILKFYIANSNYAMQSDLLVFWNNQSKDKKQDVLAEVAQEVLSVIITSASAERLFSSSSRNTSYLRMKLTKDHVQDLAMISGNKEIAIHEMEVNSMK